MNGVVTVVRTEAEMHGCKNMNAHFQGRSSYLRMSKFCTKESSAGPLLFLPFNWVLGGKPAALGYFGHGRARE